MDDEKKHHALLIARLVCSVNREVVACPHDDTKNDLIRDFDDDIGNEERSPRIGLGGPFANFIQRSLLDKTRHDSEFGQSPSAIKDIKDKKGKPLTAAQVSKR